MMPRLACKSRVFLAVLSLAAVLGWGKARALDLSINDGTEGDPLGASPPPVAAPADVPDDADIFKYDAELWKRAREDWEPRPPEVIVSTPMAPIDGETVPGIRVDLPYESGLAISGRKLIAFKLEQTRRLSAEGASDAGVAQEQNDIEMRQELQVRVKGKVGRKITVNVDFDDTKEDKRDISVVYLGDPGEFVQEAAFGDITLSLPATEFVAYSKQLFGIRTKLQYKNFTLMAIGSRTKGTTETKRFNGATKFERRVIRDVEYFKKQWYTVVFSTRAIRVGSEQVWRDDRIEANNLAGITQTFNVEESTYSVSFATGSFDKLIGETDYTMDYSRGLIFFKRQALDGGVYAIDYEFEDGGRLSDLGTPGLLKAIKTVAGIEGFAGLPDARELETFYNLGNIKIVRDNGRGNFILKTIDGNQQDTVVFLDSGLSAKYPETLEVDWDRGVFNVALSSKIADPQLYETNPVSKFSFLTEYSYRLNTFQLRPNIVFGSERVTVNGRLLRNDVDYFIDYDIGLIQFFNEDELDENSQIEVTYDYSSFGTQLGQTLVGGRAELALIPGRFQAGSTVLYTFAPKTQFVPDIRATPSSLLVLEADGRLTDIPVPLTSLRLTLSGEAAQSREDPNLFGKALIDSMEGVAQEDGTVMDEELWVPGRNPPGYDTPTRLASFGLVEESLNLSDVVGADAKVGSNETLRTLRMDFNLTGDPLNPGQPEETSVVHVLSKAGRDFSKKLYLDVWLQGAGAEGAGLDLEINAGSFREDADGDGLMDTEDVNQDGTLNEGEDIGWAYDFPNPVQQRIGGDNARIDTEDLDGDYNPKIPTTLRPVDSAPSTPFFRLSAFPAGTTIVDANGIPAPVSDLNFEGWRFFRVPIDATAINESVIRAIRQVRVTVKQTAFDISTGSFRIGKIAFVGNSWETPAVFGSAEMSVEAVSNVNNPDYVSLVGDSRYGDLYGDNAGDRTREQALLLDFNLPANSSATTRTVFGSARDLSDHRALKFFYQTPAGQPPGATLFMQLGSETDYFEIVYPVNASSVGSWILETVPLLDVNDDGNPDYPTTDTPGASVNTVGAPSLARVGQIKIGVRAGSTPVDSKLWINEIHVSDSRQRVGDARRFAADGTWGRWGSFGGTYRSVDRNFQTLTSPIVNQDREETSAYANLTRWRYFPFSGTFSHSLTVTPTALNTGQSQLVSVVTEGRNESRRARGDGQILIPKLPALAYNAERQLDENTDSQERRDRNLYGGSLDYAVPFRWDVAPGKWLTFRPLPESIFVKYTRGNYFLSYFPERKEQALAISTDTAADQVAIFNNSRTLEYSDDWQGRVGFTPWTGFTLTPSYGQRKVVEEREFTEDDLDEAPQFTAAQSYDKSFSQNHGLASSWRMFSWLEPRVDYTIDGTETNVLPTASTPTAYVLKTLSRTANGNAYLTLSPRDLLPKFKPVRTLTFDNSFRVEHSDTYNDIPQDYTDWRKLQPFRLTKIPRKDGSVMYGLLPPLELDDPGVRLQQITARNTLRVAASWSPLDWLGVPRVIEPIKTLSLSNTFTNTNEHTDNTETVKDVHSQSWLDLLASMRELEKFIGSPRWFTTSQTNVRANRKFSETFNEEFSESTGRSGDLRFTLLARYDWFLSAAFNDSYTNDLRTGLRKTETQGVNHSAQVGTKLGNWRLTPSVTYRKDTAQDSSGRLTQDLTTWNYAILGRFDKAYAGGFRLPFMKKPLTNVNRLTGDTKLAWDKRRSSLNFERDNTDTYSGEATGEWQVAQNFRLSFGGKITYTDNQGRPEDSILRIEANSQLVIQF